MNGKIVGGIGVGGGTDEQDCEIAEYVLSVFEKQAGSGSNSGNSIEGCIEKRN